MLPKSHIPPRHLNSLAPILSAVLRMSVASTGVRSHGSATSPGRQPCVSRSLWTARARYHFFEELIAVRTGSIGKGEQRETKKKQKIKYKTTDDDSLRKMRTVNIMKKKGELRRIFSPSRRR